MLGILHITISAWFAARCPSAAHDDPALADLELFAQLQHLVLAGVFQRRQDVLGADVAFGEFVFVHFDPHATFIVPESAGVGQRECSWLTRRYALTTQNSADEGTGFRMPRSIIWFRAMVE